MESTIYETGEYLAHNESWHTEDSAWKARDILRILRKNLVEAQSICEVGRVKSSGRCRSKCHPIPSSTATRCRPRPTK